MEERLGEIAGTLARTKERKNTILYKAVQRKREEENLARLGIKRLPTNPRETDDPKVMEFVIAQLSSQIGQCVENLRRRDFLSVEKDGESAVRAKNDEVHRLLAKKNAWEMKLAVTTNKEPPPFRRRKFFFGCAKELPEAKSQKREREQEHTSADDEYRAGKANGEAHPTSAGAPAPSEASSPEGGGTQQPAHEYYAAISELACDNTSSKLVLAEKAAERHLKMTAAPPRSVSAFADAQQPPAYINSYVEGGELQLPDEEHFKRALLERKKQALLGRLHAITNNTEPAGQ